MSSEIVQTPTTPFSAPTVGGDAGPHAAQGKPGGTGRTGTDDLPALHRAAAAIEARHLRRQRENDAVRLSERIAELETERADHDATAQRYAEIAANTEQLALTI